MGTITTRTCHVNHNQLIIQIFISYKTPAPYTKNSIVDIVCDLCGDDEDPPKYPPDFTGYKCLGLLVFSGDAATFDWNQELSVESPIIQSWLATSTKPDKPAELIEPVEPMVALNRVLIIDITLERERTDTFDSDKTSITQLFDGLNLPFASVSFCRRSLSEFYAYPTYPTSELPNRTFCFSIGFWAISWIIKEIKKPEEVFFQFESVITVNNDFKNDFNKIGAVFDHETKLGTFRKGFGVTKYLVRHPCYIGISVAVVALRQMSSALEDNLNQVAETEDKLNKNSSQSIAEMRNFLFEESGQVNRRHSSISTYLRILQTVDTLIASLRKQNNTFRQDYQHAASTSVLHRHAEEAIEVLEQKIRSLVCRAEYLKHRDQIQLTTVFNRIAQHDSILNIEIADASKQLATASKYDSESMKAIAVVTIVFLPATFTAALFATPAFYADQSIKLGANLWVYCAVALPLTILTLGTWRIWLQGRRKRLAKERKGLDDTGV